jgi:hypothetical protein
MVLAKANGVPFPLRPTDIWDGQKCLFLAAQAYILLPLTCFRPVVRAQSKRVHTSFVLRLDGGGCTSEANVLDAKCLEVTLLGVRGKVLFSLTKSMRDVHGNIMW